MNVLRRPSARIASRHSLMWVAAVAVSCFCGCGSGGSKAAEPVKAQAPITHSLLSSRVDHVTIVIMENHSFDQIIGNADAPYINKLARTNVLFTQSYAVTHPSEPNYLALYSGSTQGVDDDACPLEFSGPSLGGEAVHAHLSIKGYMEDLPAEASLTCRSGLYARKHNPLADFADTPAKSIVPFSQIALDMASNKYPSIAFVVPNLDHDMHDGSIAMGDSWLASNLPAIFDFDARHRGMLVLTWDEDDDNSGNHIPTIAVLPTSVRAQDGERISHYSVASTVTTLFKLKPLSNVPPIPSLAR